MVVGMAGFAFSLALSGCGATAPDTFDLGITQPAVSGKRGHGNLIVAEPAALGALDSDRIVVRPTPETIATLKGAQWGERLPRLMQVRLLQGMENSRMLSAVGRPGSGIEARLTLTSEIRRFEINVATSEAIAEWSVKIVDSISGRVVAARLFSARQPGAAAEGPAAAAALDSVFARIARDIIVWTAARI